MAKRIRPNFDGVAGPPLHAARWRLGDCELDEVRRELRVRGAVVSIEPKPLNLLMLLLRRPCQLVSKDELIAALWNGRIVTEAALAGCVAKLRLAIGDDDQTLITTVHGYGYQLAIDPLPIDSETIAAPAPVRAVEAGDFLPQRPHWQLQRKLAAAGETWLGVHVKTGEQRVFKLATTETALLNLQREVTIYRLLNNVQGHSDRVVRLFDWNFQLAPWYLELEYCEGGSLEDWLQAQGGIAIPWSRRLDIVLQIADALGDAHSAGVLHKDLKPANVLLMSTADVAPQVRLADFGSGSVLDAERLQALKITRLGSQLESSASSGGTPLYLAPEVLAGQPATQQSDVYALGVILYQLAVGDLRRPLAPGWERDVDDALLREDIAAAADLLPAHRLGSAAELARRLRELEPRRAAREAQLSAFARAQQAQRELERSRGVRRWQWRLAAVLLLGLSITSLLYLRASAAQRRAEIAMATTTAVNRFLNDDVLSAADPFVAGGGRKVTVDALLDSAAKELPALRKTQPAVAAQLGLTIGSAYYSLALLDASRLMLESALADSASANGDSDPLTDQIRLQLAEVAWRQDRFDEAEQLYKTAGTHFQAAGAASLNDLYDARSSLAWIEYMRGHYRNCETLGDSLLGPQVAKPTVDGEEIAEVRWDLAECATELGQYARADQLLGDSRIVYLKKYGEDNALLSWLDLTRANLWLVTGHLDEANALAAQVRNSTVKALSPIHSTTLQAQYLQGLIALRRSDLASAIPTLEDLYRKQMQVIGEGNHVTRLAMNALGQAYLRSGRRADARELLQRAYRLSVDGLGIAHPYTLDIAGTLAETLMADHDLAAAHTLLDGSVERAEQAYTADSPAMARYQLQLAHLRHLEGDEDTARRYAAAAYALLQRSFGADSPKAQIALHAQRDGDYSQLWAL